MATIWALCKNISFCRIDDDATAPKEAVVCALNVLEKLERLLKGMLAFFRGHNKVSTGVRASGNVFKLYFMSALLRWIVAHDILITLWGFGVLGFSRGTGVKLVTTAIIVPPVARMPGPGKDRVFAVVRHQPFETFGLAITGMERRDRR